jgi:hypothetical protein
VGKPTRAEFLLGNGELLQACAGLRVVAFEDGYEAVPGRYVQRVVAVNTPSGATDWPRYPLDATSQAGSVGVAAQASKIATFE